MLSVLTWQIRKLPILSSILKILKINKSIILSIWRKCRPFLAFFVLQEFAEIPCIIEVGTVWPNGPCCERKQKPDRSINLENEETPQPFHPIRAQASLGSQIGDTKTMLHLPFSPGKA